MARVVVRDADNLKPAVAELLNALDAGSLLRPGDRVFLKPNLTYPAHMPGTTTTPAFMSAVIESLTDYGVRIAIGESDGGYGAWSADVAFRGHGLPQICHRYGAKLVNLSMTPLETVDFETDSGVRQVAMPGILLHDTDVLITLPVPKVHSVTLYTGAVKNSWGLIPDTMRLRLHPVFNSLIWRVNELLKPKMVLADGQYMLDESGPIVGKPVFMNRVLGSDDILAFDLAVSKHIMGLDTGGSNYLNLGERYGFSANAELLDSSTGPRHRFLLKESVHSRVVAAAFPRQWAVNLLWDSLPGRLAHSLMYKLTGNRIAAERERVLQELPPWSPPHHYHHEDRHAA